jgi:hypothetical protein
MKNNNSVLPPLLRPLDVLLLIALCVLAGAGFFSLRSGGSAHVVVYHRGEIIGTYPLSATVQKTIVRGDEQISFTIANRSVFVHDANCPAQLCRRTGTIALPHQQIICAPHGFLIEIVISKQKGGVDAITH